MPLERGSGAGVVSHNIDELTHHGSRKRPHDQVVAIALHEADKSRNHLAGGGLSLQTPFYARSEARSVQDDAYHPSGLFKGDVAGRTDRLPRAVAADSFVMPADSVGILGQGNTMAGAKIMDAIMSTGPYGTTLPRARRADGGGTPGISHVMVAGGEVLIPRKVIENFGKRLRKAGKSGAKTDLAAGHKWAREFIDMLRKMEIKRLKSAPPPKR